MYNYNPYGYPQTSSVIRVNGENGARSLQLAPNSSALVLDETAPLVWLCQSDGAGYRTVTPYRIEPVKQATQESLEARIKRLEDEYESYFRQNQRSVTGTANADKRDVERLQGITKPAGISERRDREEPDIEADYR